MSRLDRFYTHQECLKEIGAFWENFKTDTNPVWRSIAWEAHFRLNSHEFVLHVAHMLKSRKSTGCWVWTATLLARADDIGDDENAGEQGGYARSVDSAMQKAKLATLELLRDYEGCKNKNKNKKPKPKTKKGKKR